MFCRPVAIFLLVCLPLYAAFDFQAHSTRSAALNNSYLASSLAADAFLLNPALSINTGKFYGSLYGYRPFSMKEFGYGGGMLVLKQARTAFAVAVENFQSGTIYNEGKGTVNAAFQLPGSRFAVGASVNAYWISASGYDDLNTFGLDVGCVYHLSNSVRFAAVINNINQPRLAGNQEELPQRIQLAVEYQGADNIQLHGVLRKDSYFPLELAFGIEYQIFRSLNLQSGFNSIGSMPSAGVQFTAKNLEFGYGMQHHFELGSTHVIGVGFRG